MTGSSKLVPNHSHWGAFLAEVEHLNRWYVVPLDTEQLEPTPELGLLTEHEVGLVE